jgi:hypothetical protein
VASIIPEVARLLRGLDEDERKVLRLRHGPDRATSEPQRGGRADQPHPGSDPPA